MPSRLSEESLFFEALEVAPDRRPEFLRARCGGDVELEQQLQQLLAAHFQTGIILDQPSTVHRLLAKEKTAIPDSAAIPSYRVLQELGEGGMGVVYMAEHVDPPRHKVALKVVKPGMDTRQVLARFEAERNTLTLLEHPHIARILDGGLTKSQRPYFVMELVRGISITDYCTKQRLSIAQRLELFAKVCDAIQHAHQKGVIHRDIKPSNVMVTVVGEGAIPKVIDFGIAKVVDGAIADETIFTRYGQVLGTPEYMSPEQGPMSGLDVDTRSDVYSLGALLYKLVTGRTPLTADEVLRDERPIVQPPSQRFRDQSKADVAFVDTCQSTPVAVRRLLECDLDHIVLKTLRVDRDQRYASAAELAADIRRFLNGEPIEASAPSRLDRLRRFVARHRLACFTATVVVLLLIASAGVSTWFAIEAHRAEQKLRAIQRPQQNEVLVIRTLQRVGMSYNRELAGRGQFGGSSPMDFFDPTMIVGMSDSYGLITPLTDDFNAHDWQQIGLEGDLLDDSFDDGGFMNGPPGMPADARDMMMGPPPGPFSLEAMSSLLSLFGAGEAKLPRQMGALWQRVFQEILVEQKRTFGPHDPYVANTLDRLAFVALETSGANDQDRLTAESYARASVAIRKQHNDPMASCRTQTLLSKCLVAQGKSSEARRLINTTQTRLSVQLERQVPTDTSAAKRLLTYLKHLQRQLPEA